MIEREKKSIKNIRNRRPSGTASGRRRGGPETEKKKISLAWLSLDSFMGKALCILLVVILAVGAFLAPKVINNLYDAGTLMQITYMDMDLSPYAVNYVTVEDKLQAIARMKTAGGALSVLPVGEEASGGMDNAALAEMVNKEIDELGWGIDVLFYEPWWSMLTEENLVSKTKYTLYGRPAAGESDTSQEMAPFQFWVLQFALVENSDETKEENKYLAKSGYTTDRIIVCMDADFYKIYAFACAGDLGRIEEFYGWEELTDIFDAGYRDGYVETSLPPAERQELRINLTEDILSGWGEYWDTVPDERACYADIQDELVGTFIYRKEEPEAGAAEETGVEMAADEEEVSVKAAADAGMAGLMELSEEEKRAFANEKAAVDMEKTQGREQYIYNYDTGEVTEVVISSADNVETLNIQREGDILLAVGARGQAVWGEADSATWIQKTGCRDFFDMMQF